MPWLPAWINLLYLQAVQKAAARILTHSIKQAHIIPIFFIFNIDSQIFGFILKFLYLNTEH